MENNEPLMTVKDLSSYLNIPVSSLYKWVSEKRIPHYKLRERLRFRREDIDAWMEKDCYREEVPSPASQLN